MMHHPHGPHGHPPGPAPYVAPVGYAHPFPVYGKPLPLGYYYKPIWTPKREEKLQRLYLKAARDGILTAREVEHILKEFGYHITEPEAKWILLTMDKNHDGHVTWAEFHLGIQMFVMSWPRMRNPKKPMKPHHAPGYNWTVHPGFPQHFVVYYHV